MLFEELVEQHRVHRFVTHAVDLPVLVPSHQVGVDPFHFLSHQAKLRDAIRIKLVLVAEGYWFKRQDRFASLGHRLDRLLEPGGGLDRAEMALSIHDHCYTCSDSCPIDAL